MTVSDAAATWSYSADAERPQEPHPTDAGWTDHSFLAWGTSDGAWAGSIWLDHLPNLDGGTAAVWFGLVGQDGTRYRRCVQSTMTSRDRVEDGWGAHDGRYRLTFGQRLELEVDDEDLRCSLVVADFLEPGDFIPGEEGTFAGEVSRGHFEAVGRITGSLVVGGEVVDVEGTCMRDRTWGVRDMSRLMTMRWMIGSLGRRLSFASVTWQGNDGSYYECGYLVRDGVVEVADRVEACLVMEADGLTYRAGFGRWHLPSGEVLTLEARTTDATLTEHGPHVFIDAMCEVERDGVKGFCDLMAITNPRNGSAPVVASFLANTTEGLTRREVASRAWTPAVLPGAST